MHGQPFCRIRVLSTPCLLKSAFRLREHLSSWNVHDKPSPTCVAESFRRYVPLTRILQISTISSTRYHETTLKAETYLLSAYLTTSQHVWNVKALFYSSRGESNQKILSGNYPHQTELLFLSFSITDYYFTLFWQKLLLFYIKS